jgi:hypothetical protein
MLTPLRFHWNPKVSATQPSSMNAVRVSPTLLPSAELVITGMISTPSVMTAVARRVTLTVAVLPDAAVIWIVVPIAVV